MEKLIYVLWKDAAESDAALSSRLLGTVRDRLQSLGAQRLKVNVADAAVAAGAHLRQANVKPAPSALVSFWLNSSHERDPLEAALGEAAPRLAGYAITESTVLPNIAPNADGVRTRGFSQLAFITQPPRLTYEGWLEVWQKTHTKLACETQSTFYYCQNIVNRCLSHGAPIWHAIVEEHFPTEAMTDPHVFYDAVGNPERYQANLKRMMDSCQRFVDFDKIDVLLTSEYRFGGWADLA